jgi:hypothetical protein
MVLRRPVFRKPVDASYRGGSTIFRRRQPAFAAPAPVPERPGWPEDSGPTPVRLRLSDLRETIGRLPVESAERLLSMTRDDWVDREDLGSLRAWTFVTDRNSAPGIVLAFSDRVTVATAAIAGGTNLMHQLPGQFPQLTVYRGTSGSIEALELFVPMPVLGPGDLAEGFVEAVRPCPWLDLVEQSPRSGPWWAR